MSNPLPTATAERVTCEPSPGPTFEVFPGIATDLGGLAITRLLPRSRRRLVGPWCFLDAFGPIAFGSGKPMDVPPHPHIGLQTVSWLLEGEILHHDSLGRTGVARPGVVNLMTAGHGIAHSEETPADHSGRLGGVQLWVALPDAERHRPPSFEQHADLPTLTLPGGTATVVLGSLAGIVAPGTTCSPLVGAELVARNDTPFALPLDPGFEHAVVPLAGAWALDDDDQSLSPGALYYLGCGRDALALRGPSASDATARALLLGGAPFGESVLMWWNFVARRSDEIVAARDDWEAGRRFGEVRAYDGPRLEAPPFVARPVP
jgi:redox-sensitive bicupin YhaK (pirin superfamily)